MFDSLTGTPNEIIILDPNEEQPEDNVVEDSIEIEDPNTDDSDSEEESDEVPPVEPDGQVQEEWQKKFKSPQEMYDALNKLEQSYNNIRPEFTRKSQELAELKKKVAAPEPVPTLPTEVNNPSDVVALIDAAVKLRTAEAIAPMQEKADMLEMENALNKLAKNYKDLEGHIPNMLSILETEPYLWDGGTEKALKNAYLQSKGAALTDSIDKIIENTLSDKDQIQAIKNKTAERSKAAPQKQPTTTNEDDIAEGILAISKSNIFW